MVLQNIKSHNFFKKILEILCFQIFASKEIISSFLFHFVGEEIGRVESG
jgi:hypothetical protein